MADSTARLVESGHRTLGKYELIRKIGAGGMGTVFLAMDSQLKRTVALKVLPRERASNPTLVMRFQAEAQAAAQLKHDNIVTVYDAGNVDGHLFIALEYVEGTDVFELVSKRGSLPVARTIEIVKQVARALEHAHKQGIVHRDIKPSNLLLTNDGMVKLTDMGLARSIDDTMQTGITREGTTVGTVDYMAPEQARDSQAADIRSDIYSLGCTWYQMLTGSPPFPSGSVTNKLYAHVSKPRPDPREKNKLVPEGVVAILHKMMARKPKDRQQTPTELLTELENIDLKFSRDQALVLEALSDDEVDGDTLPTASTDSAVRPGRTGVSSETPSAGQRAVPPREADRRSQLPPREPFPGDSARSRKSVPAQQPPKSERRASPPPPPPLGSKREVKPSGTIPGAH
ncbi:MAG: serine/threonine-protein kinase, partial [Planctomycetaceae bacterium]